MLLLRPDVEEDRPGAVGSLLREQPASTLNRGNYHVQAGKGVRPVRADLNEGAGLMPQDALDLFGGDCPPPTLPRRRPVDTSAHLLTLAHACVTRSCHYRPLAAQSRTRFRSTALSGFPRRPPPSQQGRATPPPLGRAPGPACAADAERS